jgi:hypothetical protein
MDDRVLAVFFNKVIPESYTYTQNGKHPYKTRVISAFFTPLIFLITIARD